MKLEAEGQETTFLGLKRQLLLHLEAEPSKTGPEWWSWLWV